MFKDSAWLLGIKYKALNSLPASKLCIFVISLFVFQISLSASLFAQTSGTDDGRILQQSQQNDSLFTAIEESDQARALTLQKYSSNFSYIISSSKLNSFADYSIKDAMVRIPGVQVNHRGEINLRGVGYHRYGVALDGNKLATTGAGSRIIDLAAFSVDMIDALEIKKVITPDMDASALAGQINLISRSPEAGKRIVRITAGGGANTTYLARTGPANRASIFYAEGFQNNLSVSLDINYQQEYDAWQALGINYVAAEIGGNSTGVLESVSPGLHTNSRDRFSSRLRFDFEPTEESRYFGQVFLNSSNQQRINHTNSSVANGGWINESETDGAVGFFRHVAQQANQDLRQLDLHAGGTNTFELFDVDYKIGWSQSEIQKNNYVFPFLIDGLNFDIHTENRARPFMTVTNRALQVMEDGSMDRRFMMGQNFERSLENYTNREASAKVDLTFPFTLGDIKVGAKSLYATNESEFDLNSFVYNRTLRMIGFNVLREPNRNLPVFEPTYRIPWLVDTDDAISFFESQRPVFTGDENFRRYHSDIRNFDSEELILSSYGMATLQLNDLRLLGGLRIEFTNATYTGQDIIIDDNGDFQSAQNSEESNSYFHLFPHLQANYAVNGNTNIQVAYSKTIERPHYFMLAPFVRIHNLNDEIHRGNPALNAITSNNLDANFEYFFNESAVLSAGFYYKMLNNLYVWNRQTNSGTGFDEITYQNTNETANVYGVELSWQQSLIFLPGFLKDFGVFVNYNWSQSEIIHYGDELQLVGQSPHVVNAALDYNRGRFSAQVAYHWSDESVGPVQDEEMSFMFLAPSPFYEQGYSDLSTTFRYQLSKNFRVWIDAMNLLATEKQRYMDVHPANVYLRDGLELRLGIQFKL